MTVYRLVDLPREAWPSAGGKAGVLARLFQTGYPVPDGLVLLPAAFEGDDVRPDSWATVKENLAHLRAGDAERPLAVRSSALGEDSPQASFAGAFETVLGARSDDQLLKAIRTVRRSRHSHRAEEYGRARGVMPTGEMAVLIQRLVAADISGVLFTADPVSGSCAAMTGNFAHGLGERLVAGELEPHTFSLDRPRGCYTGPPELRRFAGRLFRLAGRLEKELGGPLDIEWAIVGRQLYLLQARSITGLQVCDSSTGEWNDSLLGDYLWSNANVSEAVPDVMTPATWSLVRMLHIHASSAVLPAGVRVSGNICGRPYVNVSLSLSLYRLMGLRPEAARKRVEEMFGRLPAEVEPAAPREFGIWEFVRLVPANMRREIAFRSQLKEMPRFVAEAADSCSALRSRIQNVSRPSLLASLWVEEIFPYLFHGFTMLRGAMKWFDEPAGKLRHELISLVGSEDAHALLAGITSEQGFLDSMGPVVGVARVAQGKMTREEYLARFGHRGPHEWEVSVPQPSEDPAWLDRQLAEFCAAPVDVDALLQRQRQATQAAWERFRVHHPKKERSISGRIRRFAADARLRETVRSEVTRLPAVAREFCLRAGALTGLGSEIFFLTFREMCALLEGDDSVHTMAISRRRLYDRYRALPPYPTFINGRFDPFAWAADPNRRADLYDAHAKATVLDAAALKGFPGAAGRVEGRVRVLHSIDESGKLQPGEILVATTTNVGWTPLFPRAAAIITDVGAPLSHAAIVARELGIPAVVGCGDATARLHTGDRVIVDGGQGLVELLAL